MSETKQIVGSMKKCPQCGLNLPPGMLEGLCPACLLKQASTETGVHPAMPPFEPPSLEEVKKLFPALEILSFLGKGGMGAVYKARQPALDRIVALKLLPSIEQADSSFKDRFAREARALARLSHPGIVAVHEFGEVQNHRYFIMDFVDGATLRQLQNAGRMSPREALQIVPQICDALQYAHDQGVVHRDIKPENLMIDRKGKVVITDFGLAKLLDFNSGDVRLTGEGQVMGTPHYMAPEQLEQPWSVDHRADIYSLGVVLYEMLTGELPLGKFASPSRKIRVDVRFDEVVLHALEKEPELRYQHASQVGQDLETISAEPRSAPLSPAQGQQASQDSIGAAELAKWNETKKTVRWIANAFIALSGLVLLFFLFHRDYGVYRLLSSIPLLSGWHFQPSEGWNGIWEATQPIWQALSVLAVAGAIRFRQMQNWPLSFAGIVSTLTTILAVFAFFASSASLFLSIAIPAALLISCLSIKVILRPDVKEACNIGDRLFFTAMRSSPRWSMFALVGAGFVCIHLLDAAVNSVLNLFGLSGWLQFANIPLGTTILVQLSLLPWLGALLGWIGWEEIRKYPGKMRGLCFAIVALVYLPCDHSRYWLPFGSLNASDSMGVMVCWLIAASTLLGLLLKYFLRQENTMLSRIASDSDAAWWPFTTKGALAPRLLVLAFVTFWVHQRIEWPTATAAAIQEDKKDFARLYQHTHPVNVSATSEMVFRGLSCAVAVESISDLNADSDLCWQPDGTLICGSSELIKTSRYSASNPRRIAVSVVIPLMLPTVGAIPVEVYCEGTLLEPAGLIHKNTRLSDRQTIAMVIKAPQKAKTIDIAFGLPQGKWEDTDAGWYYQNGLPRHSERTLWRDGHQFEVRPYEVTKSPLAFGLACNTRIQRRPWIERLIAVDNDGRIYEPTANTLDLQPRFGDDRNYIQPQNRLMVAGNTAIQSLRLQMQPLQYARIQNISLIPGRNSHPQWDIVSSSDAGKAHQKLP